MMSSYFKFRFTYCQEDSCIKHILKSLYNCLPFLHQQNSMILMELFLVYTGVIGSGLSLIDFWQLKKSHYIA